MELQIDPKVTYALALGDGAGMAAWQRGLWRALREADIRVTAAVLPDRGVVACTSPEELEAALTCAMADTGTGRSLGRIRDIQSLRLLIEEGYKRIIALRAPGFSRELLMWIPRGTEIFTVTPAGEMDGAAAGENTRLGYYDAMRFLYGLRGKRFYIDNTWSEEEARSFLSNAGLRVGGEQGWTLRSVHEKLLPTLAEALGTEEGDYRDMALALLERSSTAGKVSPWRIYTEGQLLETLGGEGAVDPFLRQVAAERRPPRHTAVPRQLSSRRETGDVPDKLRVCLLNDSFPPTVDGVANAVANYARILTDTEGGCVVVTPDYPGVRDDYPYPVVRYPSIDTTKMVGYRAGNPLSLAVTKKLAGMNLDLIHSHCPVVSTILARILRENIQKPVVITYHTKFNIDIENTIRSRRVQETAIRLLVNNISACDEVWVVSRGAGENLRSLGYEGDYLVMPNGVDLARGRARPEAVAALSEKWNLKTDAPVFLFVGRMMWYKGLRLILDGLKLVRDAGQDFRMVFVGDGRDRGAVETYARELGLYDLCRFVGAELDRETIRAWYTRSDLLLFPSTFDTNGLVIREAAACGVGSVLIRDSCAAEDIVDGDTGILIPETAGGLAEALLRPGAGREQFRRIGQNASEKIYLSWEDSVANARRQYRSVVERWRSGELRRRRAKFDGFFDLTGDVGELLEHTRSFVDDVLEKYF